MKKTRLLRLTAWLTAALIAALPSNSAAQVVEYYHLDAVGSVRAVTSQAGAVIERHDYYAYGEECTEPPCGTQPGTNTKKFTGKERDVETGLDYFGARYYGSRIGRFTSVDPLMTIDQNVFDPKRWNRYAYGANNPCRNVDTDGRDFVDYLNGAANAFGSNLLLGAGRVSGGNDDFRFGQFVGDAFSVPAGVALTGHGLTAGAGGIIAAPETGGASLAATAAGTVEVGLGTSAVVNGTINAVGYFFSKDGSIYVVPGSGTPSGKPYVGRHNKPNPAKTRKSNDGRDRTQAEVVDTYDPTNKLDGRQREQKQIDAHGLENLDNKRNEIRKD